MNGARDRTSHLAIVKYVVTGFVSCRRAFSHSKITLPRPSRYSDSSDRYNWSISIVVHSDPYLWFHPIFGTHNKLHPLITLNADKKLGRMDIVLRQCVVGWAWIFLPVSFPAIDKSTSKVVDNSRSVVVNQNRRSCINENGKHQTADKFAFSTISSFGLYLEWPFN